MCTREVGPTCHSKKLRYWFYLNHKYLVCNFIVVRIMPPRGTCYVLVLLRQGHSGSVREEKLVPEASVVGACVREEKLVP